MCPARASSIVSVCLFVCLFCLHHSHNCERFREAEQPRESEACFRIIWGDSIVIPWTSHHHEVGLVPTENNKNCCESDASSVVPEGLQRSNVRSMPFRFGLSLLNFVRRKLVIISDLKLKLVPYTLKDDRRNKTTI